MSKKFLSLICLIKERSSLIVTTDNFHQISNKIIFTQYDLKEDASAAQRHVNSQMAIYPVTVTERQAQSIYRYNNKQRQLMSKITRNLNQFTFNYNYLLIMQARLFFKQLNNKEINDKQSDLKLVKEWISFLLQESSLHDYTIEELKQFQKEIIQKEKKIINSIL